MLAIEEQMRQSTAAYSLQSLTDLYVLWYVIQRLTCNFYLLTNICELVEIKSD